MSFDPGRCAGVVVGLLLLAAGCSPPSEPDSLEELAGRSLAQISGELDVSGLREPVEVIRDEWGIPHIYAQNDDDLFLAQGYVMAQDRLWQMEMWRRWHEGRLSEIFGPEAFNYDLRTRQMMFRGPWDESEWTSYHPDGERIFTAYANGVNAYIEQHRDNLPVEFQLTGVEPDPWTAKTVVLRWAAVGLSSVRGHVISEIELAMRVDQLGAEEANRRATPDPWDDLEVPEGLDVSIITETVLAAMRAGDGDPFSGGRLPDLEVVERYRSLMPTLRTAQVAPQQIATEGSNNWVMSGDRSPTGVPILANDPHRRIEMPALRYFVHLNARAGMWWAVASRLSSGWTRAQRADGMGLHLRRDGHGRPLCRGAPPGGCESCSMARRVGTATRRPGGDRDQGRSPAYGRAEVQPPRPGHLRGSGEPRCLRRSLGRSGSGHGRV